MAMMLGSLGMLLVVAGQLAKNDVISGETSRKGVHLALGFLSMSFPWLFHETWPVWILAVAAMFSLAGVRLLRPSHAPERRALHGVDRESYGEFCFPLAVAIVFSISAQTIHTYLLAIATLTFADSAGALVGRRFGRHAYKTDEGTKTIEGSLAVMITTSVAALILLPETNDTSWLNRVLMASLLGLLITLIEAVALRGFDNLFIPLLTVGLTEIYHTLETHELAARFIVMLVVVWLMVMMRRGTRLNDTGLIGCSVLLYLAYFMAEWKWVVAPVLALFAYNRLSCSSNSRLNHTLGAASAVLIPGYFWLVTHMIRPSNNDFVCYQLAFSVSVSLMAISEWNDHPARLKRKLVNAATLGAVCMTPVMFFHDVNVIGVVVVSWMLCLVASILFMRFEWQRMVDHGRDARWLTQGAISLLLSFTGVLV